MHASTRQSYSAKYALDMNSDALCRVTCDLAQHDTRRTCVQSKTRAPRVETRRTVPSSPSNADLTCEDSVVEDETGGGVLAGGELELCRQAA
eukprot:5412402-Prymnesium_polylepis.1